jgi:hypothetical protein
MPRAPRPLSARWSRFARRWFGGSARLDRRPFRPALLPLEDRVLPDAGKVFALGAGTGAEPRVTLYDATTGQQVATFLAYDPTFRGGVRVALADLTGDGTPDIVTAPGPGAAPLVKVFDGQTHAQVRSFLAYDANFRGGVFVVAGDIGNGRDGIVTGPDTGGVPRVNVFDAQGTPVRSFLAYDPNFRGGVRVALGYGTNGNATVVTGPGQGGGPQVKVFETRTGNLEQSFMAYDPTFRGGVWVATGDLTGDRVSEVVTGPGMSGGPHVKAFDGASGAAVLDFMAGDANGRLGARVGLAKFGCVDEPGDVLLFAGVGVGTAERVEVYAGQPAGGTPAPVLELGPFAWGGSGVNLDELPGTPCLSVIDIVDGDGNRHPVPIVTSDNCYWNGVRLCKTDYADLVKDAKNQAPAPSPFSANPVSYNGGVAYVEADDLASAGFGTPWGQTRTWSNNVVNAAGSFNGYGWVDSQRPTLQSFNDGATVVVTSTSVSARTFQRQGDGSYLAPFYLKDTLTHDTVNHQFVLTDEAGDRLTFWDYDASIPALRQGQLQSFTDPDGNLTQVVAWTTGDQVAELRRTSTSGGVTVDESYAYSYVTDTSDPNFGLIASVTLQRRVNGGAWSTVRSVAYTYYDGVVQTVSGDVHDLKTAQVKDASGAVLDTYYYRYYTPENFTGGVVHGLKYVLNPRSYDRLPPWATR